MAQGRKRLKRQFRRSLDQKQDRPNLVPALLGAYVNGQKTLLVAGREDFAWCRIRGSTSEVVQAFNETVGLHWDLPVLIYRDPNFEGIWKVYGRDITQYEDWEGVNYLPHHGSQHSFRGGQGSGSDPVWVYKRQFMPFLPRPIASGDMSIFIEQDLYYWDGEFHWWGGSGTEDLTSYKPTGSVSGKFLTVYIEGSTETLKLLEGDEFNLVFAPDNPTEYIPVPAASQGIPIASVMLQTGTTSIGWHEIFDLRLAPSMFPTTGTQMGVYDEHVFQGGVSNLDFIGDQVQAVVSGSYAFIEVTAAAPGDDQIGVYNTDDGQPLGTGTRIDWGDNLDVSISGTTVRVDGQAGGGGGSGSVIVLDDGSLLGSAEKLDFIGAGVSAVLNAETAEITISGGDSGSGSTYVRAGEANPLDTVTGIYWRVPDLEFATGTLSVAINGIWQTPVDEYSEQYPSSGTFVFDESPPTGSIVSAIWGVLAGGGEDADLLDIYEDGGLVLADAEELDFVGAGVDVSVSGSRAQVDIAGGGGGGSTTTIMASHVIEEIELSSATGTVDFLGIPDGYDWIEVRFSAKSTRANVVDDVVMLVNNDSSADQYYYSRHLARGAGHSLSDGERSDTRVARCSASNAPSNEWGAGVIELPEYAKTDRHKSIIARSGFTQSTTDVWIEQTYHSWKDTSAINRLTFSPSVGPNFVAGTRFLLLGYKETEVSIP